MKELVPSNHEVRCNRHLLNAASSEIFGPETPLNILRADELVDFLMRNRSDENIVDMSRNPSTYDLKSFCTKSIHLKQDKDENERQTGYLIDDIDKMRIQFDFPPPETRVWFRDLSEDLHVGYMSTMTDVLVHSTPGKTDKKVIKPPDEPPGDGGS